MCVDLAMRFAASWSRGWRVLVLSNVLYTSLPPADEPGETHAAFDQL